MDYETVIEAQLDSMDLSGLEDIMGDAAAGGGIFEGMTVDQVINNLINGEALFDSERIMDNLINLFLMEVKGSVFLGCEILAICIVTGLLSNFSNTFGSKTVSSLGTMICGVVITALCISNFYQTYQYCQDTINTMTASMEILLPVMIPLLISMGGISSGSIMSPAMAGAVTGSCDTSISLPVGCLRDDKQHHGKGLCKEAVRFSAKRGYIPDRTDNNRIYRDHSPPGRRDQVG